jgi:hypothetical protein
MDVTAIAISKRESNLVGRFVQSGSDEARSDAGREGLSASFPGAWTWSRTGENPTYGILGGAAGNVDYGGTEILPRNRKSGVVNLHRRSRAPVLHPTGLAGARSEANRWTCG